LCLSQFLIDFGRVRKFIHTIVNLKSKCTNGVFCLQSSKNKPQKDRVKLLSKTKENRKKKDHKFSITKIYLLFKQAWGIENKLRLNCKWRLNIRVEKTKRKWGGGGKKKKKHYKRPTQKSSHKFHSLDNFDGLRIDTVTSFQKIEKSFGQKKTFFFILSFFFHKIIFW